MRQRLQERYVTLALQTMNFIVLFVAVNLVVGFGFTMFDKQGYVAMVETIARTRPEGRPHMSPRRTPDQLEDCDLRAYDEPEGDVEAVLDEMTSMQAKGLFYQPFEQYSMAPYQGRLINVDVAGGEFPVRRSLPDPALRPDESRPVIDVFVFGGSTTFGWNVADRWTLPSSLWDELQKKAPPGTRVRVTNLGRPSYYSSLELPFFDHLVKAGHTPDVAVFVDGLNDLFQPEDKPMLTDRIAAMVNDAQRPRTGLSLYSFIPIVRLAYALRERGTTIQATSDAAPAVAPPAERAAFMLHTYRHNNTAIAALSRAYGTRTYQFWQPVPIYHFDADRLRHPPFGPDQREAYRIAYDAIKDEPQRCIFLADVVQEHDPQKVFVDPLHYSPSFNRRLAQKMAAGIDLTGLRGHPPSQWGTRI